MSHTRYLYSKSGLCTALLAICSASTLAHAGSGGYGQNTVELTPIGTYATGIFDDGAAEIVAHDAATQRLFVVNGADATIDVLDISDPSNPQFLHGPEFPNFPIDVTVTANDAKANSVAVHGGLVAAAVENTDAQMPGAVIFFDAVDGTYRNRVVVGADADSALPDMVTFSPNGDWVLVANEGEPSDDYSIDPEGSVSIVDLRAGVEYASVVDVDFRAFNTATLDSSIRIFGPNASVAQDLEPEFIAVSDDSLTAWVVLQENNAVATVDIVNAEVTSLSGLGFKDHSSGNNTLDASNRDGFINPTPWPVNGMYQPDSMVSFEVDGEAFLITANEGDARDYPGFSEEARVADLMLDPTAFPNASTLQRNENLGRLKTTITLGDHDGDGLYEEIYSYGARSFSIWGTDGSGPIEMVFDSGDALERITAAHLPDQFNSTDNENFSFDDRSDDKGPEPEGLAVGKVGDRTYAFIGLERIGGIVVYDVTDPYEPTLAQYINTRDFSVLAGPGAGGDLAPEGLDFISADDSPTGQPLLAVAYEVSGTTTIFAIDEVDAEFNLSRTYCNSTLTGLFNQVIAIPGGTCVLSGATVFDGVRAAPGSTLFIYGGVINDNIESDPGASLAVLSSIVGGNIECTGAVGPSGCQISGTVVDGNVRSDAADEGFVSVFSNFVDGNVRLSGNAVQSFVSLNIIAGNLECSGNSPAPNLGGLPPSNIVGGNEEGQCAASWGF